MTRRRILCALTGLVVIAAGLCAARAEEKRDAFDTAGSIVVFGRYEQDGDGENGPEPVEWIVLDVQDGKSLLISRLALDAVPYHTEDGDIIWAKCSLRTWLNENFLKAAFTEEEQEAIPEVKVDNSQKQGLRRWNNWKKTKGGKDTRDRIFLLSCLEAKQYLGVTWDGEDNPPGAAGMTEYLRMKTAGSRYLRNRTEDDPGYGCIRWWLRSPGYLQNLVAVVQQTGVLIASGATGEDIGVRPAMWVDLKRVGDEEP